MSGSCRVVAICVQRFGELTLTKVGQVGGVLSSKSRLLHSILFRKIDCLELRDFEATELVVLGWVALERGGAVDIFRRLSTVSPTLSTLLQFRDIRKYQVEMTPKRRSSRYTRPRRARPPGSK